MKTLTFKGSLRTEFGKKAAKQIRKNGEVPCELYGKGTDNVHFQLKENELHKLLITPDIHVVELDIDGKTYTTILQDTFFHPVSDRPLHLDFLSINEEAPIIIEVPIELTGLAAGVKAGGKLNQAIRKIKVQGLYKNIPEKLIIDVTALTIGKSMKVGQLTFNDIELITPKQTIVCSVKATRASTSTTEAEETAPEGEETEAPAAE